MQTLDPDSFPNQSRRGTVESAPWLVMKFGGTSVSSARNWAVIRDLISERIAAGYRPFVVHSALAGVSNRILEAIIAAPGGNYRRPYEAVVEAHMSLAAALAIDGPALVGPRLGELEQLLAGIQLLGEVTPRAHARGMAMGELMATAMGAAWLRDQGVTTTLLDAREILTSIDLPNTSERMRYINASCEFDADPALQDRCRRLQGVVLTQGFIASNAARDTVILGRGGSDTSGAYFAGKLQARGLEIWTDVPGMFSANPRSVQGARLLRTLSYAEAQEIASTGGSVLHPRCIAPVRRHGIPLRIKDTTQPTLAGTLVTRDGGGDAPRVKAISGRTGVTLVSMETPGMWQQVGFLADAFRCFSDAGLSIDLVSTSETNVTVTLDPGANAIDAVVLEALRRALAPLCRVEIIENVEVVSLVGQRIRSVLHEIGPVFDLFDELPVHLVSQAASDLNLSLVVGEGQSRRTIQAMHELLIQPGSRDSLFGPTWEELRQTLPKAAPLAEPWWARRRNELIGLATTHGSAYVYDLASVRAAAARVRAIRGVSRALYAMKANSNPEVLRAVHEAGLGFECVSPGEIDRVLGLFPDLDPRQILYTPNFAPRADYEHGLDKGVWLTLDNVFVLREWGSLFTGREIFLRIDTGHGHGHHEHVRTAGAHSKFGIPLFELAEACALAEQHGVRIVGLHAHTGSGILQPDNWRSVAAILGEIAGGFPQLRYLDLGGGLGVPEKRGGRALDLEALSAGLDEIRAAFPAYELWLEPGRYVIAEAGVLVTSVTQLKGKGDIQYVGVSTGMNSLIRPALYGAYHEIANLSRWGEPATEVVNIVGPNCESGDKLGTDRLLPVCQPGDVLAIGNAGAYGFVMSSRYNLREPAAEFAI
ncbi:MAG: bifunctional aspartate kinase/diaminopimelate decarboxylase [Gammaproteobacteria bacterium]|nr:bifunctional aspartate kinase/diaminopimelate decarboxylase [Gammaproteobacteria bacterium]